MTIDVGISFVADGDGGAYTNIPASGVTRRIIRHQEN